MVMDVRSRTIWRRTWVVGISCMLLLIPWSSGAQITFERVYGGTYDDCGHSAHQTLDGGYVAVGYTASFGAGAADVYSIKTDSFGNILWDSTYGGIDEDQGHSIQQTSDGGYIIAGETRSFGAGQRDVYLIKTGPFGNSLWEATSGGSFSDLGSSVLSTLDGGYTIAGETRSFGAGQRDVYLVKADSFGNTVWETTYGGSRADCGYSVRQTLDAGYIVAGEARSFGAGLTDVYLIKADSLGVSLWTRTYGGTGRDGGHSVQQTLDGGYIIAGHTESFGSGLVDVYLIKADSLGNTLWDTTYGGSSNDEGYSVQQTQDGGYIIAGYTESFGSGLADVYLIKTDPLGNTLWERTHGGSSNDEGNSVQQTSDGGYVVAGYTESFGSGLADVYLIKTDSTGMVVGIEEEIPAFTAEHSNTALLQNMPNPFSGSTIISYSLAEAGRTTLDVYSVTGRFVETLMDQRQEPGVFQVNWDAKDRPIGVYFYRLTSGTFSATRKTVLMR